jgi:fumarate hydratase, class I
MEILEFSEFGKEAIYIITVNNFPAFIIVDDKDNNFFIKIKK